MRSGEDRRLKVYRGAWYVVWRENGRTRRSALHTKDRATAERNFQEFLRQDQKLGGTISEILDLWAEEKKALQSIEITKSKFKAIKGFWGNLRPEHITPQMCDKYVKERNKKSTTVRNELAILRSAVNWHDKHNKAVFKLPRPAPPRDHSLTKAECKKLLDHAIAHHIRLFIVIALCTGARSAAILELTWDRVDFEKGLVNLATGDHKNKKRALLPMNPDLRKALEEAYKGRTSNFVIEYGAKQVKSVKKSFRDTAKRAGLVASPHVLRHTAAVLMAEAGVPMSEIAQYLGHSSTVVTERVYARYSPTYLSKAASALNIWGGGSK